MTRTILFALALSTLGLASPRAEAAGAPGATAKEQVKLDKKALRDDEKDQKQLARIVKKWQKARASGNDRKEARADEQLGEWLGEELAENRMDVRDAEAEFIRAGGDPRVAETAGRAEREHPAHRTRARQQPKVRTPRRAMDDLRDLEKARAHLRSTREIARELKALQHAFAVGTASGRMYQQKDELLGELLRGAARDIRMSQQELAESERRR